MRVFVGDKPVFAVAAYCGSKWYRLSDWKMYLGQFGLIRKIEGGFSIGPILFWDGK